MNTGLDQLTLNQIITLSRFVEEREFLAESKSEIYAIECLQQALGSALNYLQVSCLNDKHITDLGQHITDLEKKIQETAHATLNIECFKNELSSLLSHIEENSRLNTDSKPDPILDDVIVLQKGEFSEKFDHLNCKLMYKQGIPYLDPIKRLREAPVNCSSNLLPGSARTKEEYDKILKKYKGVIEILPLAKLRSLIDDPSLNLPSNSMILPQKEFVPQQVLMDLPRLTKLVINGKSCLEEKDIRNDKDRLFCFCMEALKEDIEVTLAVMKLLTQASLARITYVIYNGFQFIDTLTRVSQGLGYVISVRSRPETIEIKLWAYFGIISGENSDPSSYVGVMRKMVCPRDFLLGHDADVKGEVVDIYSPVFPRLKDLKRCDFDSLAEELKKEKLLLKLR